MRHCTTILLVCLLGLGIWTSAPAQPAEPATGPAALIAEAERETARLREPEERALCLADIALAWQKLGDARWEKTWAQGLEAAETVTDPVAGPLLWRSLAVRFWPISEQTARGLLERALKGANDIRYPSQQALALREIGRAIGPLDAALAKTTLEQAAEAARKIPAAVFRAAALRDVASAVTARDPAAADKLFAEAAGAIPPADPDEAAQLTRLEVAAQWSLCNLDAALAEAEMLGDARLRETCYRRICEALAPVDPDGALSVIAKIHDEVERPLAVAALAASLVTSQPETAAGMARSALASAEKMPAEDRQRLQAEVAVAIAPESMPEAMALLKQVEDEDLVTDSLRLIIVHLAAAHPEEALRTLETTEDWQAREGALIEIMPILAKSDPERAAAVAKDILSRRDRVKALLTIAAAEANKEAPPP